MSTRQQPMLTEGGVVLGVDTHLDAHVAVVLDGLGRRRLDAMNVPADTSAAILVTSHLERLEAEVVVEDWGAGPWPRNHHLRGEVVQPWDE